MPLRALRHDGEFAFAAEVVADVALGKELADQGGRFALRSNRIRDHHVAAGPPERFLDNLAARKNDGVRGASFIIVQV